MSGLCCACDAPMIGGCVLGAHDQICDECGRASVVTISDDVLGLCMDIQLLLEVLRAAFARMAVIERITEYEEKDS